MKLKINQKKDKDEANKSNRITKDTLIAYLVTNRPDLAEILTEDYGFHCVGCFASSMETLEQGAQVHGMSEKEIEVMVEKLNNLLL